jgi:peptidoglycan/xylan/chitin deacetylase (PgdA/CDA1 family)
MRKVILTFDYELFLGKKSGSAENSILKPTNEIIRLLKKYNAKAIFFVDTTYLLALKRFNHPDLEIISRQLKEIIAIGSSIELHLHPQWMDAEPKGDDEWKFKSFEHYRLHSLKDNEIVKLFNEAQNLLIAITGIKPIAFRAGGWSITPFQPLKKAFLENDIKIDMSVLGGFSQNELPLHYYDFLNAPNKEFYKFENDVLIENPQGNFLEIPVTTFEMHGFDLVLNTVINKLKKEKCFGDGKGLKSSGVRGNRIKRAFSKNLRKATIENQSSYMFKKALKQIKNREILSYVMHPKTLSQTSLTNFEYLLQNFKTLNSQDLLKEFF